MERLRHLLPLAVLVLTLPALAQSPDSTGTGSGEEGAGEVQAGAGTTGETTTDTTSAEEEGEEENGEGENRERTARGADCAGIADPFDRQLCRARSAHGQALGSGG